MKKIRAVYPFGLYRFLNLRTYECKYGGYTGYLLQELPVSSCIGEQSAHMRMKRQLPFHRIDFTNFELFPFNKRLKYIIFDGKNNRNLFLIHVF